MDREEVYRIYVTDILKALGGAEQRYFDLFKKVSNETRTPEEIIQSIKDKIT